MVRQKRPASQGPPPPRLTWRPRPTGPAAENEWAPAPHPAPPQPHSQGYRAGGRLSPSAHVRLDSAPPPSPARWRRPSPGVSARVHEGTLHFLPPAATAAAALSAPPHPARAGESLRTGRGWGGGQRPWGESDGGRRRELGDSAEGGACSQGRGDVRSSGGLWGRRWGDRVL